MRVLVCGLGLVLTLVGCARDKISLGSDDTTAGGNPINANGDNDDAGDPAPIDSGANTGGKVDSGPMTMCAPATCASPTMDAGSITADVAGAAVTIPGMGHAFVKVSAKDGQSFGNSAGGIRATLTSTGGNYDLFAYGGPSNACDDLSISSTNPPGQPDEVAPIWGVNGPAVTVDWTLTFEVRPAAGPCAAWTLKLEGNPCAMQFTTTVPKECP